MVRIRILVVDDHPIVRQGIRSLLSNYAEFEIVAEADNGRSALHHFRQLKPDVTLLDIRMPDESGLDVLNEIRSLKSDAKVLMLTSFDDSEYVLTALRAGAQGYVLKGISDDMLVHALRAACRGEKVLSPQVTEQVVQWAIAEESAVPTPSFDLDEEERQILRLLVDGASNPDIAEQLYMSQTTVKRKLRTIFAQLNVETRTQAAAEAVRYRLV
ncbi:MAG: response regulator transcription factor [Anaerolineaceae bacterium]|nr:response regulator transcription factor [Anaerolineaceae bacterium]